jgi:hypothetical protein
MPIELLPLQQYSLSNVPHLLYVHAPAQRNRSVVVVDAAARTRIANYMEIRITQIVIMMKYNTT